MTQNRTLIQTDNASEPTNKQPDKTKKQMDQRSEERRKGKAVNRALLLECYPKN